MPSAVTPRGPRSRCEVQIFSNAPRVLDSYNRLRDRTTTYTNCPSGLIATAPSLNRGCPGRNTRDTSLGLLIKVVPPAEATTTRDSNTTSTPAPNIRAPRGRPNRANRHDDSTSGLAADLIPLGA